METKEDLNECIQKMLKDLQIDYVVWIFVNNDKSIREIHLCDYPTNTVLYTFSGWIEVMRKWYGMWVDDQSETRIGKEVAIKTEYVIFRHRKNETRWESKSIMLR